MDRQALVTVAEGLGLAEPGCWLGSPICRRPHPVTPKAKSL